jgi:hypothetical protein
MVQQLRERMSKWDCINYIHCTWQRPCVSLICVRQIQRINVYTKWNMIIYKFICLYILYIYAYNIGTTLWNLGSIERKREGERANNIETHCICVGRWHTIGTESHWIKEGEGKR